MGERYFEKYLEKVFEEVLSYEARFSREYFEICLLVSWSVRQLLEKYSYGQYTIMEDQLGKFSYLFGHRVVFVDDDFIPVFGGGQSLIHPVIVCNAIGVFPMEAEIGDYIFFNGRLVQVVRIDYINGNRSIHIEDIDIDLGDKLLGLSYSTAGHANRHYKPGKAKQDDWMNRVDTSAIDDYLSSLTVT